MPTPDGIDIKEPETKPPRPPDTEVIEDIFGNPSGGSSSGGGGSAPRATAGDYAENQYVQQMASVYVSLWGTPPPPGYLERFVRSGMNLWEFEAHERAKPAFRRSPRFVEEQAQLLMSLAREFGGLG